MPKESLIDALKRKFRTPEEALAAMGINISAIAFDEAILGNTRHYQENTMPRRYYANDQAPSADACLNAVRAFLDGFEDPEERREFLEQLSELVAAEPANPRPGEAEDRTRRRLAHDAAQRYRAPSTADQRRFDALYPSARRIGIA